MSKLNHLYNAEKILYGVKWIRNGGDNLLKACPSIQWSLIVGKPFPSCFQPHRRLCHVPWWSYNISLLLGLAECISPTTLISWPQRSCSPHCTLINRAGIPHMLWRLQGQVLVQATSPIMFSRLYLTLIFVKNKL